MYYGSIIDAITRATMAEARDPNLLSQQGGQDRREWLTDKEKIIDDWLKQHMGPGFYEGGMDALKLGGFVSQGEDIGDASFHSRRMLDADNWPDRISSAMMMALLTAAAFVPGNQAAIVRGVNEGGDLFRRALSDTSGSLGRGADDVIDALRRGSDDVWSAAHKAVPSGKADDVIDTVWRGTDDVLDNASRFIPDEAGTAYRGLHTAPFRDDFHASLDDLSSMFGVDIYGPDAARYFGHGGGAGLMDQNTVDILQKAQGNPNADITIYRAVPDDVDHIFEGDWVTVNKDYAIQHGDSNLGGDYRIIEQTVKADELFTDANSIHEFGYSPRDAGGFDDLTKRFMADETGGFGGLRAKDVDLDALARAKQMAASDISPDEIWFETGWMYDTDGFWKFEIDDSGFRLQDWAQETIMDTGSVSGKADDIFVMDDLGRSYPQLREVGVEIQGGPSGHGGFGVFDETGQPVAYGSDAAKIGTRKMYIVAPDEGSALHVAVHELSGHGIQDIEGFAAGGSPDKYIGVKRRANPDWDVWDANRELAAEGKAIIDSTDFKVARVEANRYLEETLHPDAQARMNRAIEDGTPHDELIELDQLLQKELDEAMLDKFPIMRELRAIEEVTPLIEPPLRIPTDRAYFEGAGEVSARNVQTRGLMPEDVRRTIPPQHTVDVPPEVQSIDFDKGPPTLTQRIPDDHPLSPSQTAFATYESIPGQTTGHLAGAADADEFTRKVFTDDPLSSWQLPYDANTLFSDGGDILYAGQRGELGYGTGSYQRPGVQPRVTDPYGPSSAPTIEMQGIFQPDPMAPAQLNPGHVARPYTRPFFDGEPDLLHTLAQQDEISRLTGTEAVRGYIDAQDMSAWHNPLLDPAPGDANAMWLQGTSERPLTVEEVVKANVTGIRHGLPNVVDTGQGLTMTDFADPHRVTAKDAYDIGQRVDRMDAFVTAEPANVVSGYTDYSEAWRAGEGSGQATQQLLDVLDETPANIVRVLNNNPEIPRVALDRFERDTTWAEEWGATRADIQNARKIIGEGAGWIGRLREGLRTGEILPAIGFGMLLFGHEALNQQDQPYYGIQ